MGFHANPPHPTGRPAGRRPFAILAAAIAVAALALTGCGSSGGSNNGGNGATNPYGGNSTPTTGPTGGGNQTLTVKTAPAGAKYLTDSAGKTLYLFQADSSGKSNCNGPCAAVWPPVTGSAKLGSGVSGNITTFTRSDGAKQIVFNGHPLYEYTLDTSAGDVKGEELNAYGGLWYAVSPTGDAIHCGPRRGEVLRDGRGAPL